MNYRNVQWGQGTSLQHLQLPKPRPSAQKALTAHVNYSRQSLEQKQLSNNYLLHLSWNQMSKIRWPGGTEIVNIKKVQELGGISSIFTPRCKIQDNSMQDRQDWIEGKQKIERIRQYPTDGYWQGTGGKRRTWNKKWTHHFLSQLPISENLTKSTRWWHSKVQSDVYHVFMSRHSRNFKVQCKIPNCSYVSWSYCRECVSRWRTVVEHCISNVRGRIPSSAYEVCQPFIMLLKSENISGFWVGQLSPFWRCCVLISFQMHNNHIGWKKIGTLHRENHFSFLQVTIIYPEDLRVHSQNNKQEMGNRSRHRLMRFRKLWDLWHCLDIVCYRSFM